MVYLWDRETKQLIGSYHEREDAVKAMGGIISLFGENWSRGRFILTKKPSKQMVAEIVYQPYELFQRGLVYLDRTVYERSTHKR